MEQEDTEIKELNKQSIKKDIIFKNLKIGFMVIAFIALMVFWSFRLGKLNPVKMNSVAIINFNEQITVDNVKKTITNLDEIFHDDSVREVLFVINSPGGSPAASEELSSYLKRFSKNKPITMYIESIAASGGYYIASAVKPLYSNQNAIVGSIGVIMPHYSFEETAKHLGVKEDYLAAGKFKKPVSLLKDLDDETKLYMQENLLQPTYQNFLNAVAKNRGISVEKIMPFAEGKIFIANSEKIRGVLIDEISTLIDIKTSLVEKHGPETVFYEVEEKNGLMDLLKSNLNITIALPTQSFEMQ